MILKVLKSLSWATGVQLMALFSGLFFSVLVARTLGPSGMGVWAFYSSLMYILVPLSTWAMDYVLQREILSEGVHKLKVLKSALTIRFLFGILASVIFLCLAVLLRRELDEVLQIGLLFSVIPILGTFGIIRSGLEALQFWKYIFFIGLASTSVLIIGGGITSYMGWGIQGFASSKVLECVTLSLFALFFVKKIKNIVSGNIIRSVPYMLKSGSILALTLMVGAAYSRIDQILIVSFISEEALGVYAVAIQLLGGWWALGNIIVRFFQPVILAHADRPETLNNVTQGAFVFTVLFGIVAMSCNLIFGQFVVNILFGPEFKDVYKILVFLSPAIILLPMLGVRSSYMIGRKLDGLFLIITSLGLIITFTGNVLLLPRFGLWGAVISLNLCYIVVAVAANFLFSPLRPIGWIMIRTLFMPFSRESRANTLELLAELGNR